MRRRLLKGAAADLKASDIPCNFSHPVCTNAFTQVDSLVYTTSSGVSRGGAWVLEHPLNDRIPYSGYFSRGNIFVKVVILAISWKKFRGRAVCLLFWARARGVFRG